MWTTARQHPGETMAEFFMEGLIGRLLDETDATARNLRRAATFYCVPNMNPGMTHISTIAYSIWCPEFWR